MFLVLQILMGGIVQLFGAQKRGLPGKFSGCFDNWRFYRFRRALFEFLLCLLLAARATILFFEKSSVPTHFTINIVITN